MGEGGVKRQRVVDCLYIVYLLNELPLTQAKFQALERRGMNINKSEFCQAFVLIKWMSGNDDTPTTLSSQPRHLVPHHDQQSRSTISYFVYVVR